MTIETIDVAVALADAIDGTTHHYGEQDVILTASAFTAETGRIVLHVIMTTPTATPDTEEVNRVFRFLGEEV